MSHHSRTYTWSLCLGLLLAAGSARAQSQVTATKAPFGGFRPRAVMDASGVLHLVQASQSSRVDLVYLRREPGAESFSEPVAVNTTPGIVAAFDMAVGAEGRVHVLMRTNPKYSKLQMPADQRVGFFDLKYMLYARLNDAGDAFEEERNLAGPTIGFEGVGTILADGKGQVLAFWHGQLIPKFDEPSRQIYRTLSTDGGKTFSEPEAVTSNVEGACQCCPLIGHWGSEGSISLAFRNSTVNDDEQNTKDSYVMLSRDFGRTFEGTLLDPWEKAGCPGSIGSVTTSPDGTFVAWRTRGVVKMSKLTPPGGPLVARNSAHPRQQVNTRVPVLVSNNRGEILFLWVETDGPQAKGGGHIAWKVFDRNGMDVLSRGRVAWGVASRWGSPTAYAKPDGSFEILYDGEGT